MERELIQQALELLDEILEKVVDWEPADIDEEALRAQWEARRDDLVRRKQAIYQIIIDSEHGYGITSMVREGWTFVQAVSAKNRGGKLLVTCIMRRDG